MDPQNNIPSQPIQPEQPIYQQQSLFRLPLIIGSFIVLVIVGASAYYIGTKQTKNQPIIATTPTQSPNITTTPTSVAQQTQTLTIPDETVNWKTYTNLSYGFSFQYPSAYLSHDDGPNQIEIDIKNGLINNSGTQVPILDVISFTAPNQNPFSLNIYPVSSNPQFNTNVNNLYEFADVCGTQFADKTLIDQISQIDKVPYKAVKQTDMHGNIMEDLCLFSSSNNLIVLRGKGENTANLLNQILSTFKFTLSGQSGNITGILCFPSDHVPSGTVTAKNIGTGEIFTTNYTWDGQLQDTPTYKLALKPGNYHVKYDTLPDPKGLTGQETEYYTENATCINSPGGCTSHSYPLLTVTVQANQTNKNINVCDSIPNPNPPNF